MVRTVSVDGRTASAILRRSDEIIVILATSMAMSLPLPIAILKSAWARAALSLIPSPTIATRFPCCCNSFMNPAFCAGRTSAR